MSAVKILVAAIIAIPLLLMGTLAVILANPESYREELTNTLETSTGYRVEINGDMSWRYWPPIALNLTDLEVGLPNNESPLMSLKEASIDLDLMPLLTGDSTVGINGLSINGLHLSAMVNKDLSNNWDSALQTAQSDVKTPTPANAGPSSFALHIDSMSLSDSTIIYQNQSTGEHYKLTLNSLGTGEVSLGEPISLNGQLIAEDITNDMRATTSIEGAVTLSEDMQLVSFSGLTIDTEAKLPDMDAVDVKLVLTGKLDQQADTLKLSDAQIAMGDFKPKLTLQITKLSSDNPNINGHISLPTFNAKLLMSQLGIPAMNTTNPSALTSMTFSGDIAGSASDLSLRNIDGLLDQSKLAGSMSFKTGTPNQASFKLTLDKITVSDYLEPLPADGQPEVALAKPVDSEVIPVSVLNETTVDGQFSIGQLLYEGFQFNNFVASIKNNTRRLTANISMQGYGGDVALNLKTDLNQAVSTALKMRVNKINLVKMLETEAITGDITMTSDIAFTGSMMSDIMNTVDGTSRFDIGDGTLDVTPIKQMATTIDSVLKKPSGIADWPDIMPFEHLNGQHNLVNGAAADQAFNFSLENLKVTGAGGFDYFANALDYKVKTTLTGAEQGAFSVSPALAGIKWPIHCKGTLDASIVELCFPDSKAITKLATKVLKQQLKRKGKKKVNKLIDEKAPEELKGLLKDLFK